MSDLSDTIRVVHGETDSTWELTTSLPTDDDQGIILLQVPACTDPEMMRKIHEIIESTVYGLMGCN